MYVCMYVCICIYMYVCKYVCILYVEMVFVAYDMDCSSIHNWLFAMAIVLFFFFGFSDSLIDCRINAGT